MNLRAIAALVALFSISEPAFAGEVVKLNDFLKNNLSSFAKSSKEAFNLSAEQQAALKKAAADATETSQTFYFGKDGAGKLQRACTAVPQQGKEGPMTVGVCFDPQGLVTEVAVLSHEEEKGKKAAEGADFLKQFKGKKAGGAFTVGKDVDAVSGATVTSKSISEAIRKAAFGFKQFVEGKK